MTVEKEKLTSLDGTTVMGYFPSLSTFRTTTAGNALGKSSYANITDKPSGKKVTVRTLFTPEGNGIDVVVLVDSIRAISERFANTAYDRLDAMLENGPWFIWNNPLILKKWHPDENLLKEDNTASSSGNKKKGVEPTIKVSNSNPFDVLNSVDNDMEFGTNGETSNLMEVIKVMTSLLEQLRDSYPDNDDYDPYDDDMYKNHDLSEHLQSICDDLDITVHGRKKK
nr:hypothetical protein [Tanacetum cinerariifolium]